VHLSPKAFDLLAALIQHRDRALAKGELHERLWPGVFVTEANLASLIAEVRRALDDPPAASKFIRTVHRFGYAFCGPVVVSGELPAPASHWLVWRGQEFPLRLGENVVGRDESAHVRIDAPSVSRRHASIVVTPEGVTIEDLGSKNGTSRRDQPISGAAVLADLDEIVFGSVRVTIRISRSGATTQTVDTSPPATGSATSNSR
jgi:hypothetical protein